jgi:hypothetical protein
MKILMEGISLVGEAVTLAARNTNGEGLLLYMSITIMR